MAAMHPVAERLPLFVLRSGPFSYRSRRSHLTPCHDHTTRPQEAESLQRRSAGAATGARHGRTRASQTPPGVCSHDLAASTVRLAIRSRLREPSVA